MVSFCFSFSSEFWPIHWYEVMIRSRRDEKEMKEHEEEQRLEGDIIISNLEQRDLKGKKKNRKRRKVPKKKKKKKKNTTK